MTQPAGYGNGGIESMDQFVKLSEKITNSLRNLEYTRDMLHQLSEIDKKSAKSIATIMNQRNKKLRFSVVDQAIQNYWKKQEADRRHFSDALQTKIIKGLDSYIATARERKKKLTKENSKIQRSFIECKKETLKLKQIGLKEWQKLEEQIQKNEQHKKANKLGKMKDLKPLQNKCSAAFSKYESFVSKLNELEQSNHAQACKIGELLHESQKYASDRLSMHYNMAVAQKKFCDGFIGSNKSIVQSKAPPLNDILWRWLTFPKNHQTHSLPCTSKEVFSKQSIGQGFKRRVEPDYQSSEFLKQPKSSSKSPKSQNESSKNQTDKEVAANKQQHKSDKKKHKKEKKHKKKIKKEEEEKAQPTAAVEDEWNVDFGADATDQTLTTDTFNGDNKTNDAMSNDDFFGGVSAQNDIFGTVEDVKVEKKEQIKEKDLVQQHNEANVETNGFDAGFDDNFDFGDNKDVDVAQQNVESKNKNIDSGFGGDWDTNFGDDDLFGTNDQNTDKQEPQNEEDVDQLFAASAANDIFGGDSEVKETAKSNDDDALFSNNFGDDDLFGNSNEEEKNEQQNDAEVGNGDDDLFGDNVGFDFEATPNGDAGDDDAALFDDEFDDEQAIEFPEFDMNETVSKKEKISTKSKKKGKTPKAAQDKEPQSSPQQPDEIMKIQEPIISFDAPFGDENNLDNDKENEDHANAEDNPFGSDPFGGDGDDDDEVDDADNPFAFDEPETSIKDSQIGDEFDPFA